MNWQKCLKGKLKINEDLARHTSFNIGGPVRFWFEPRDPDDLRISVLSAGKKRIPVRVIGAGSNILADDRGLRGIIVKLSSPYFKKISIEPPGNYIARRNRRAAAGIKQRVVRAGAGVMLTSLLGFLRDNGLGGLELLAGIPGTLGGALVMNAQDIGNKVLDVMVMDRQGRINILKGRDIRFAYRNSNLDRYIVLGARLKLIKQGKRAVRNRINRFLRHRRRTQDLSHPSCGCFFKNPDLKSVLRLRSGLMASGVEPSAAYFIESCGLKGKRIGDAAVSSRHANFIINKGRASFIDVLRLMKYITRRVKTRFDLDLQPEIRIWKRV